MKLEWQDGPMNQIYSLYLTKMVSLIQVKGEIVMKILMIIIFFYYDFN